MVSLPSAVVKMPPFEPIIFNSIDPSGLPTGVTLPDATACPFLLYIVFHHACFGTAGEQDGNDSQGMSCIDLIMFICF